MSPSDLQSDPPCDPSCDPPCDPPVKPVVDDDLLALDLVRGVKRTHLRRMLSAFGSAQAVLASDAGSFSRVTGCSPARARECLSRFKQARTLVQRERCEMEAVGCRLLAESMSEYPPLLRLIPDPPLVLRIRGAFSCAFLGGRQPSVAVVGSRRPSGYGERQARRFAEFFSEQGVHVVSGGARGIDAIAHRHAASGPGGTSAVMGCGLARTYPAEHAHLFESILDAGGALLSEFPMNTPPRPNQFPRRNRLVSGLALGVLVIEAAERSGALITARLSVEDHGRESGGVPGRVDDPCSLGCLKMIAEGWGALIRTPAEAMEVLIQPTPLFAGREAVR